MLLCFSFFPEEEEEGSPLSEDGGSDRGEGRTNVLELLSPDDKQQGGGVEVEAEQGGSVEVERLMTEIQGMHLVVQALLKGSRNEEGEEEEEEQERGGVREEVWS